ncbi:unnamed protein product, partial [Iphiclides podalirius]
MNASVALGNGLISLCPDHDFSIIQTKTCYDFSVYEDELVHPIGRDDWQHYYQPGSYNKRAFAHRVWGTTLPKMEDTQHSVYADIARTFCPWVHSITTNSY